jgi:hypothetical protein
MAARDPREPFVKAGVELLPTTARDPNEPVTKVGGGSADGGA